MIPSPRTKLTPEMELLICSSAVSPDPAANRRLASLVPQLADMHRVVGMAIREGLACLLYKNLLRAKLLDGVDEVIREKLQGCYRDTVLSNLRMIHDMKEILGSSGRKGIQVVLLQGILLLREIYRDPGLRPMRDIDLWVMAEQFAPFREVLLGLGYRQDAAYPNTFRREATLIDVHTHILWAERVRAMAGLLAGGQGQIFRAARPIHFEGQEALCLQPADEALYLSLHIIKHNASKLLWLVDLRSVMGGWNPEEWLSLAARANELDLERPISQVLYLLKYLFGWRLPADITGDLGEKRLTILEKKVLSVRTQGHPMPFFAPLLLFTAGRGLKFRLSLVTETLFPRPEILRHILEGGRNAGLWSLYWKRLCYLLRQVSNSLKGRKD